MNRHRERIASYFILSRAKSKRDVFFGVKNDFVDDVYVGIYIKKRFIRRKLLYMAMFRYECCLLRQRFFLVKAERVLLNVKIVLSLYSRRGVRNELCNRMVAVIKRTSVESKLYNVEDRIRSYD